MPPPTPLQLLQPEPGTSLVHVLSTGQVLAADEAFSDWFGYKATEVIGNNAAMLVTQAKILEECVRGRAGGAVHGNSGCLGG